MPHLALVVPTLHWMSAVNDISVIWVFNASLLLCLQDKLLCIYYSGHKILIVVWYFEGLSIGKEFRNGSCMPQRTKSYLNLKRYALAPAKYVCNVHCNKEKFKNYYKIVLLSLVFLSTNLWLTLVCWKCDPIPIPDGEPGEGTGEVLGEGWRFPVISIMSWPMSFSSSSGKGRSNMSSEGRDRDENNVSTAPQTFLLC